jgi:anthranilate phosphoribosyltransferase
VLVASALVVAAPVAAQASGKDTSASTVISSTKAAIASESGVHVLVTSKISSSSTKVVADIGATSGIETITRGSDVATIKVTPTYAYLSGNAAGLTTLMGLSAKQQKKVGTDTISMKN